MEEKQKDHSPRLIIASLLPPHLGALLLGFIAIAEVSIANLLQPWPLKIVLDVVLRSGASHTWATRLLPRVSVKPVA
jgi:ATP-binding cassette, subfamily B, bacterial